MTERWLDIDPPGAAGFKNSNHREGFLMHRQDDHNWRLTSKGDKRGYIQPQGLHELWLHTGTACNLRCPFCFEDCAPGNTRLQALTLNDARPFIDEAVDLGVNKFSFTGGEPFVNRELPAMLDYALDFRPCLVLTNGTEPLAQRLDELVRMGAKPNALSFRVSLDHPDPRQHDAARGTGRFQQALDNLARLHRFGFGVSIARLMCAGEDSKAIDQAYIPYFHKSGLPLDLTIIKFPDFHKPGASKQVPEITEDCMTRHLSAHQRDGFMCNFSKMIVKQDGRCGVYACTLVDDDGDYQLGTTLRQAMPERVMLKHHRCFACFACGSSCSEAWDDAAGEPSVSA